MKSHLDSTPRAGPVRRSHLLALASPGLPLAAMGLPLSVFVPPFYASLFHQGGMTTTAALSLVGAVFMAVRFFDVFTDPLMGIIGDRFESRWGRRKHWCVIAVPIMMLGVVAVFIIPKPELVTPAYLMAGMVVFYIGSTMLTISIFSWGAELSPDYNERSRINGAIQLALFVGGLLVMLPPAYVELFLGDRAGGRTALLAFGAYLLLMLPLTVAIATTIAPERATVTAPRIGFWGGTKLVLRNNYMRRLLVADFLVGIPGPLQAAVFFFFVRDVVGALSYVSVLLIINTAFTILSVPLWVWVAGKLGKHRAFCVSTIVAFLNVVMYFFIDYGETIKFGILLVMSGVVFSAFPLLLRSMAADAVDADNLESGGQRTALYFSLITMTQKFGGAAAIGIAYPILGFYGFDPSASEQTSEAMTAVRYTYTVVPATMLIAATAIMWKYPLDRMRQLDLRTRIEERDVASRT